MPVLFNSLTTRRVLTGTQNSHHVPFLVGISIKSVKTTNSATTQTSSPWQASTLSRAWFYLLLPIQHTGNVEGRGLEEGAVKAI